MTQWPAWATAPVRVCDADPRWQELGDQLTQQLDASLAPWLVAPVEHVGSTSVPGLAAKPVIDLQAAVADLACAGAVADALADGGWHLVPPEEDDRPWRAFLVRVDGDERVAHLHLLRPDSPRWRQQLEFRDALRGDPDLAARYAALKRELAKTHADDREAYTESKGEFVQAALSGEGPRTRGSGRELP